jgi:hypothetical protein
MPVNVPGSAWRRFLEMLETLAGKRGPRDQHAIRWQDIEAVSQATSEQLAVSDAFVEAIAPQIDDAALDVIRDDVEATAEGLAGVADALTELGQELQIDYDAAVQAATDAGASATAAATSAGLSSQNALEAGVFRANAEQFASAATLARTDAVAASAAASTAAGIAVQVQSNLELISQQSYEPAFLRGAEYWIDDNTQNLAELTSSDSIVTTHANVTVEAVIGEGNVLQTAGATRIMSERGQRPFVEGQQIEVVARVRLTVDVDQNDPDHTTVLYLTGMDEAGEHTATIPVLSYAGLTLGDSWQDRVFSIDPKALRDADSTAFASSSTWRISLSLNRPDGAGPLASTEQVSYVTIADVTGSNGLNAAVTTLETVTAEHGGRFSALWALGVVAGEEEAGIQIVAADDPLIGVGSEIRLAARNIIAEGTLVADDIRAGIMNARHIEVTERLNIDAATGAFSMGKTGISDFSADGIFIGRQTAADQSVGFAFFVGRTAAGQLEYIKHDDEDGLIISNPQMMIAGGTFIKTTSVTTETVALPLDAATLALEMWGGGGGGAARNTQGQPQSSTYIAGDQGQTTLVRLLDDGVFTGFSWSAVGGISEALKDPAGNIIQGPLTASGQPSTLGAGQPGSGGRGGNGFFYDRDEGPDHRVSPGKGGRAAPAFQRAQIDLTNVAVPQLEITIGAGGAGGVAPSGSNGGPGVAGRVDYSYSVAEQDRALMVGQNPSAEGQFVITANVETDFPDFGAGYWVIWTVTHTQILAIESLLVDDDSAQINAYRNSLASFYSRRTPRVTATSNSRTVNYKFYRVG